MLSSMFYSGKSNDLQVMRVINESLGQTQCLTSSEHCFRLKFVLLDFEKWGRTYRQMYGRTKCVKIVITIDCDCGSASWIKKAKASKTQFMSRSPLEIVQVLTNGARS